MRMATNICYNEKYWRNDNSLSRTEKAGFYVPTEATP